MTGLSRECKADGKSSNDTEIDYFHSFRFFLTLFTLIRGGVIARMYTANRCASSCSRQSAFDRHAHFRAAQNSTALLALTRR